MIPISVAVEDDEEEKASRAPKSPICCSKNVGLVAVMHDARSVQSRSFRDPKRLCWWMASIPFSSPRYQRDSIDNIDATIIQLLAERSRCTRAIGKLPPGDPAREAEQVNRLRRLALVASARAKDKTAGIYSIIAQASAK